MCAVLGSGRVSAPSAEQEIAALKTLPVGGTLMRREDFATMQSVVRRAQAYDLVRHYKDIRNKRFRSFIDRGVLWVIRTQ